MGEMLRQVSKLLKLEMLPVVRRLPAYTRLAFALMRDKSLRVRHKAVIAGGAAYLVLPVDLIPGIIPVLGQLDDLAVALWSLRIALRGLPPEAAEEHLRRHGLSWELLDGDISRVGRSGRLLAQTGLWAGRLALRRGGRVALQLGLSLLERARLPRRLTA
jgi:uncharacterized membrane protein YkvA (DUF1232 family)